jgi:hypothetical protein
MLCDVRAWFAEQKSTGHAEMNDPLGIWFPGTLFATFSSLPSNFLRGLGLP